MDVIRRAQIESIAESYSILNNFHNQFNSPALRDVIGLVSSGVLDRALARLPYGARLGLMQNDYSIGAFLAEQDLESARKKGGTLGELKEIKSNIKRYKRLSTSSWIFGDWHEGENTYYYDQCARDGGDSEAPVLAERVGDGLQLMTRSAFQGLESMHWFGGVPMQPAQGLLYTPKETREKGKVLQGYIYYSGQGSGTRLCIREMRDNEPLPAHWMIAWDPIKRKVV